MKKRAGTLAIVAWLIGQLCSLPGNAYAATDGVIFNKLRDVQLQSSGVLYVSVGLPTPDPLACGKNPAGARIFLPTNFPNYALAVQVIFQGYIAGKSGQFGLKAVGSECEITRITFY